MFSQTWMQSAYYYTSKQMQYICLFNLCWDFFFLHWAIAPYCTDPSGWEARLWKHWGKLSLCHIEANWSDLLVHSISPKPSSLTPHPHLPKGKHNNKHRPLRMFFLMRKSILLTVAAATLVCFSSWLSITASSHWFFSHFLVFFSCLSSYRKKADCICNLSKKNNNKKHTAEVQSKLQLARCMTGVQSQPVVSAARKTQSSLTVSLKWDCHLLWLNFPDNFKKRDNLHIFHNIQIHSAISMRKLKSLKLLVELECYGVGVSGVTPAPPPILLPSFKHTNTLYVYQPALVFTLAEVLTGHLLLIRQSLHLHVSFPPAGGSRSAPRTAPKVELSWVNCSTDWQQHHFLLHIWETTGIRNQSIFFFSLFPEHGLPINSLTSLLLQNPLSVVRYLLGEVSICYLFCCL